MAVHINPIADSDVRTVAEFLETNLSAALSTESWVQSIVVPWRVAAPNRGFMLVDDGAIVGVYLAFYSERTIDGVVERFCNLGSWCVLPEYRFHSMRLLKALLAQPGYHFTDLSPNVDVAPLNSRLGFRSLDTTLALIPNLPWPSLPSRDVVSASPTFIEQTLTGRSLEVYRDHAEAAAAHHLVLRRNNQSCYVMFRKARIRKFPFFVSILYVSDPVLFRKMARRVSRHLLLHHHAVATLAELRVIGERPTLSFEVHMNSNRKMYRSPTLAPDQVDYLYSELACVAW